MILLIEDHDDSRHALLCLIQRDGFEAVGFADGPAALHFMASAVPQLVLLDYELPAMDGLEILSHIRRDLRLCNVPVILMSACDESLLRPTALRLGANDYLSKASLDWQTIHQCIQHNLPPGP